MYIIIELTPEQQAQVNALMLDKSEDGPVIAQVYPDGIICRKISVKMAKAIQAATGHLGKNTAKTLKERFAECQNT